MSRRGRDRLHALAAPARLLRPLLRLAAPLAPSTALHRMVWASAGLVLTFGVGILGYVWIEDFSPFDALYQTALTLTTVGFQEVHPLSRAARAFTIFLMLFGVGTALYLLAAIASLLLEGELYRDVGARRERRMIDSLSGHMIIAGAGRMGMRIAADLARAESDFVLIEHDPLTAGDARSRGWLVVEGDAEDESVLRGAGMERARRLMVATGDDDANAFIIVKALDLAPELQVYARCNDPANERVLRRVGADRILSPIAMMAELYRTMAAEDESDPAG